MEVLREVRQNNIKDMHETFVCCLMSHGDMGTLVGADGESVTLRQLTELLRADLCPQLATKTKIFILESCQGTSEGTFATVALRYGGNVYLVRIYMFLHSWELNEGHIKCIDIFKLNTEFSIMYGYNLFYMM